MKTTKRCDLYCPACKSYIENQSQDMQIIMRDMGIECIVGKDTKKNKVCAYFRLKDEEKKARNE